jgi:hypothetical protein
MGYEFAIVLDHDPSFDELDNLFEAGCSDADIEFTAEGPIALFNRQADSLTTAISSAVRALERAGFRATEVIGEAVNQTSSTLEYAKEIAAANFMVATRAFIAAQRSGSESMARVDA